VLTASTQELQAFMQKYADDPEAFDTPGRYCVHSGIWRLPENHYQRLKLGYKRYDEIHYQTATYE